MNNFRTLRLGLGCRSSGQRNLQTSQPRYLLIVKSQSRTGIKESCMNRSDLAFAKRWQCLACSSLIGCFFRRWSASRLSGTAKDMKNAALHELHSAPMTSMAIGPSSKHPPPPTSRQLLLRCCAHAEIGQLTLHPVLKIECFICGTALRLRRLGECLIRGAATFSSSEAARCQMYLDYRLEAMMPSRKQG